MATLIFNDLLVPTMIFLGAAIGLTSMTCQYGGKGQKIAKGDRQVFSKGWRYALCTRPQAIGEKLGTA